MMSGVPLETCWAFSKLWNNKFYYKAASCWYFYWVIHDARIHEYQKSDSFLQPHPLLSVNVHCRVIRWRPIWMSFAYPCWGAILYCEQQFPGLRRRYVVWCWVAHSCRLHPVFAVRAVSIITSICDTARLKMLSLPSLTRHEKYN